MQWVRARLILCEEELDHNPKRSPLQKLFHKELGLIWEAFRRCFVFPTPHTFGIPRRRTSRDHPPPAMHLVNERVTPWVVSVPPAHSHEVSGLQVSAGALLGFCTRLLLASDSSSTRSSSTRTLAGRFQVWRSPEHPTGQRVLRPLFLWMANSIACAPLQQSV